MYRKDISGVVCHTVLTDPLLHCVAFTLNLHVHVSFQDLLLPSHLIDPLLPIKHCRHNVLVLSDQYGTNTNLVTPKGTIGMYNDSAVWDLL